MYHVDLLGRQLFEKINFSEERVDLIENPLLGPLLRRRDRLMEDELMNRKANKIAIYYLNLHKRYDLDVRISLTNLNIIAELSTISSNLPNGLDQSLLLSFYGSHRTSRHLQKWIIFSKARFFLQFREKYGCC